MKKNTPGYIRREQNESSALLFVTKRLVRKEHRWLLNNILRQRHKSHGNFFPASKPQVEMLSTVKTAKIGRHVFSQEKGKGHFFLVIENWPSFITYSWLINFDWKILISNQICLFFHLISNLCIDHDLPQWFSKLLQIFHYLFIIVLYPL